MAGQWRLESLLRKLFGKQEGEKIYDAVGVLVGSIALVIAVANQSWWLAAASVLIVVLSGLDLLRERRRRPDSSDDDGLVGEMVSNPPSFNPLHHEPLPPFPANPGDEVEKRHSRPGRPSTWPGRRSGLTPERECLLVSARLSANARRTHGTSALRLSLLLRLGFARGRFSSAGPPILFAPEA